MHYLVDGHNLIGQMARISLEDPDDEVKLVLELRSWSARGRKRKVTVYFDGGLPGGLDRGLSTGQVKVVFASAGRTADSLLINHIRGVKNPGEFTLVSSDHAIVQAAEKRRLPVIRAEKFASDLLPDQNQAVQTTLLDTDSDPQLEEDEIEMWLRLFGDDQS